MFRNVSHLFRIVLLKFVSRTAILEKHVRVFFVLVFLYTTIPIDMHERALRTQKNHIGWLIEKPIETTKTRVLELLTALKKEIDRLENK